MLARIAQAWANRTKIRGPFWRWAGYLLTLAAIAYLVYTLARGELQLRELDWENYGAALAGSLGFYLVSLLIQFHLWGRLLSAHRRIGWQDFEIYSRAVLMRSLPGGAWHWFGRITMYSGSTEVPTRVVVMGNFLEWALQILVGAAIFLALINIPVAAILGPLALTGAALALGAAWQPAARSWPQRLAESGLWVCLYVVVWLAGAAILYLLIWAASLSGGVGIQDAIYIWTFSGSLSMLIIFLPSSLGIREISLVALLQPFIEPSTALVVALLIRVLFMFADFFWGIIGWMVSQAVLKRRTQRAT
jgi:hypothetical protein